MKQPERSLLYSRAQLYSSTLYNCTHNSPPLHLTSVAQQPSSSSFFFFLKILSSHLISSIINSTNHLCYITKQNDINRIPRAAIIVIIIALLSIIMLYDQKIEKWKFFSNDLMIVFVIVS